MKSSVIENAIENASLLDQMLNIIPMFFTTRPIILSP